MGKLETLANDSNDGFYQRIKRIIGTAAAAGALYVASGCAAPYHHNQHWTSERETKHKEYMNWEYGAEEQSVRKFAEEALKTGEQIALTYEHKTELDNYAVERLETVTDATKRIQLTAAYDNIKRQNESLKTLFEGAKLKAYLLKSLQSNADVTALQTYSYDIDPQKVEQGLQDLATKLKDSPYALRQELKTLLAENSNAASLFDYNEAGLKLIDKFCVAGADAYSLEGAIEGVVSLNVLSSAIQEELSGVDQLAENGLGQRVLEAISTLKMGGAEGICSAQSKVVSAYNGFEVEGRKGKDLLISDVYKDILDKVWEEARDWREGDLHTIVNEHLANALSIANEAFLNNRLGKEQYQALTRFMTAQVLQKMGDGRRNYTGPDGMDYFLAIGGSILPITDLIIMFSNMNWALCDDTYNPNTNVPLDAVVSTLERGNQIKGGWLNSNHLLGDAGWHRFKFWSSVTGFTLKALAAGGVLTFGNLFGDSGNNGGGGAGGGLGGGETGGPGTGN